MCCPKLLTALLLAAVKGHSNDVQPPTAEHPGSHSCPRQQLPSAVKGHPSASHPATHLCSHGAAFSAACTTAGISVSSVPGVCRNLHPLVGSYPSEHVLPLITCPQHRGFDSRRRAHRSLSKHFFGCWYGHPGCVHSRPPSPRWHSMPAAMARTASGFEFFAPSSCL